MGWSYKVKDSSKYSCRNSDYLGLVKLFNIYIFKSDPKVELKVIWVLASNGSFLLHTNGKPDD